MKQAKAKRRKKVKRATPTRSGRGRTNSLAGVLNFDEIHALLDLMNQRGVDELELDHAGTRIRIKRAGTGATSSFASAAHRTEFSYLPANPAPVASNPAPAPAEARAEAAPGEELHIIKSPIVGTFYAAPAPEAPPFVQAGDYVEVGQVLCIIEAMKLMNEIESDVAGEVVKVYVENGQPVEYGESLFAIRPTKKK